MKQSTSARGQHHQTFHSMEVKCCLLITVFRLIYFIYMYIYYCSSWGHRELDMTWRLNNNYIYIYSYIQIYTHTHIYIYIHIKYQDYMFVLVHEVKERTELFLTCLQHFTFSGNILGINKGGRGKRIGERDRTSVLLEKNTLAKKKKRKQGPCSLQAPVSPIAICNTVQSVV